MPPETTETGIPVQIEPALQPRAATAVENSAGDWLCGWCLNRVANEKDRFQYDGETEFTFTNPEGIRFDIMTFSPTIGCRNVGTPTLEHTWFPGHTWSFCLCERCDRHLGWFYSGLHDFAGLIRNRLVRGLCVRN